MQYFGGKYRIAHLIANYINRYKPEVYLEPFCGMCNVGLLVNAERRIFSDSNPYIIAMWKAIMDGWEPPFSVSEKQYIACREGDGPDYLIGFVGIACAFSGIRFSGYARNNRGRDYAEDGKNSIAKIRKHLRMAEFHCWSYDEAIIHARADVVYCDPPYRGTAQPYFTKKFDTALFWRTLHEMRLDRVFVSEYNAPEGVRELLSMRVMTDMRTSKGREERYEKLFGLEGGDYLKDYRNPTMSRMFRRV